MEIDDYTWGELLDFVNAQNEAKREEYKALSLIAYGHADLVSAWVYKKTDVEVFEAFPFWSKKESEEMKKEAMLQKYKNIMQRHASQNVNNA